MISITKLLFSDEYAGDRLRYSSESHRQKNGAAKGLGPVVVWNSTRRCNLSCRHCYIDAQKNITGENEMSTREAEKFIDSLAECRVPALLFSGGEPLIRPDIFHLIRYTKEKDIQPTLSTNGTLITAETAKKLKESGLSYVGISLDGIATTNDDFRGKSGAFKRTLDGIRNCVAVGQRVGLRFTLNKRNISELERIFDFIEQENIDRACFYHLVYTGRGSNMITEDIASDDMRQVMDTIVEKTRYFAKRGLKKEILTVDNHCDGIYLYLKAYKEGNLDLAEKIKKLLIGNGGNRSGMAFGAVDPAGNVHPDQFTQDISFGNVREKSFGQIWENTDNNHILAALKNRKKHIVGRCQGCQFFSACNGNFRARAKAITGDFWESDPACYLTEAEISTGFF